MILDLRNRILILYEKCLRIVGVSKLISELSEMKAWFEGLLGFGSLRTFSAFRLRVPG